MSSNPESSDSIDHLHLSQNSHVIVFISLCLLLVWKLMSVSWWKTSSSRGIGDQHPLSFSLLSLFSFTFIISFLCFKEIENGIIHTYIYKFTGGLSHIPFTYSLPPSWFGWELENDHCIQTNLFLIERNISFSEWLENNIPRFPFSLFSGIICISWSLFRNDEDGEGRKEKKGEEKEGRKTWVEGEVIIIAKIDLELTFDEWKLMMNNSWPFAKWSFSIYLHLLLSSTLFQEEVCMEQQVQKMKKEKTPCLSNSTSRHRTFSKAGGQIELDVKRWWKRPSCSLVLSSYVPSLSPSLFFLFSLVSLVSPPRRDTFWISRVLLMFCYQDNVSNWTRCLFVLCKRKEEWNTCFNESRERKKGNNAWFMGREENARLEKTTDFLGGWDLREEETKNFLSKSLDRHQLWMHREKWIGNLQVLFMTLSSSC